MSLPGYSAEASLYHSSGHYRATVTAGFALPNAVAIPQQKGLWTWPPIICFPFCVPPGIQICCYRGPFGYRCFTHRCPPIIWV